MTKKNNILGKDAFMQASRNLKRELVELEELGGSVWVRELSGKQLLEYNEKIQELQKGNPELTASNSLELISLMVSLAACDEDGNLLFSQDEVKQLMDNSFNVLVKLSTKAMELSGLGNAVKEVSEQLKNAQTSSSTEN